MISSAFAPLATANARRARPSRGYLGGGLVGAVLLTGLGSGCNSTVSPIVVAEDCPATPVRGPAQWADAPAALLIDDFEGDEKNQLAQYDGRDGAWVVGSDLTSVVLTAESSSHCAARGAHAGHFKGEGFTDWGANWTAIFRQTAGLGGGAQTYDATEYSGLSFWAAVAPSAERATLPLGITTIDVAWNGGVCTSCMDYYGTAISLDSSWRRYTIAFDELMQSGSGEPLLPIRTDQLVGFILWPEAPFDLWIDDVRFER